MPYRRLPNTDKARLRALERAFKKVESGSHESTPFSAGQIQILRTFLPRFQNSITLLNAARRNQIQNSSAYNGLLKKARMYVSHYIQVMNMAISRGEQKPAIRKFYKLEAFGNSLPPLNSESDLLYWGKKVIDGDKERVSNGGSPLYNPSIALVKVNFEKYSEANFRQKQFQQTTIRNANLVQELREEANDLIQNLWNEAEAAFEHLPDSLKRENAKQFGVVYAFRKSELKKPSNSSVVQQELIF